VRRAKIVSVIVLLMLTAPAWAQVSVGEASMNLSSTIAVGYTDEYSNNEGSSHNWTPSGVADLTGYYYNPNFLSFMVEPFYNQSRVNSDFQSITAAGGVSANAGIFSGSRFPGTISFSKIYNNSGSYAIPGLPNYTTHGDSDSLAVTWGINLDDLPRIHLGFNQGSNDYSVYGANTEGNAHHYGFNAGAAYDLKGFHLNGGYQYNNSRLLTPQFLSGQEAEQSDITDQSISFNVAHKLPWSGSFNAGYIRESLNSDWEGETSNTTIDTVTSGVGLMPVRNLTVGAGVSYTNNLAGTLYSGLINAGVPPQELAPQYSSNALGLTGTANYDFSSNLHLFANVSRQQQDFSGQSFVSDSFTEGVTYFRWMFGGQFTGTVGFTQTSVSNTNQTLLGIISSAAYSHQFGRWSVAGSFNYAENTQTALAAYTGRNFGYSADLGRKITRVCYWSATAAAANTYLSYQSGPIATSQTYGTSFSLPIFSINGSYTKSSGNAFTTSTGLVPTPVPPSVVNPELLVLFNGTAYAVGAASHLRHLTISGIFSQAISDTESAGITSHNHTNSLDLTAVYHLRKLDFNAGYLRFNQGFSTVGTPPTMITSFYFGVRRWLHIF